MAHDHDHALPQQVNKSFAIAVGLNLIFTLIEAVYAVFANSMSLLADAGHNLGDVLGLLLAWGANWLLTKPATERYSYGYRRTTVLASITNALFLVATSALIAYGSIAKFFNPEPVQEGIVIIVATLGILINGGTALLFLRGQAQDLNIKGAFLHLLSDAVISVGVVITAIIIWSTDWLWVDPLVGLMIVVVILLSTWGLLRNSLVLLLDAVPHSVDQQAVKMYFQQMPGITAIHDLHIWGLSTKEIALTVHLVAPNVVFSDEDFHHINQELKTQFKIHHVTIQVEKGSEAHPCHLEEECG